MKTRHVVLGLALAAVGAVDIGQIRTRIKGAEGVRAERFRFAPSAPPMASMLSWVPPDADGIVIFRQLDRDRTLGTAVAALGGHPGSMTEWLRRSDGGTAAKVIGVGGRPSMAVTDLPAGTVLDARIAQLDAIRAKLSLQQIEPARRIATRPVVLASDGWKDKVVAGGAGPRAELIRVLARAPANAAVIAGYVPALEVSSWPVRTAVGWAVVDGDRIAIDGELDANDEASSKWLLFDSIYWGSNFIDLTADCQAQLSRVAKQLRVDRAGARIVFHADLAATEVAQLATCGGAP